MPRPTVRAVTAGLLLLAAACSDRGTGPTGPSAGNPESGGPAFVTAPISCPNLSLTQLQTLSNQIFKSGTDRTSAQGKLSSIQKLYPKRLDAARAQALDLIDFTLKKFYTGKTIGTSAQVTSFVNGVSCLVGLGGVIPTEGLTTTSVVTVVPGNNPAPITITTGDEHAGISIPAGASPQTFVLTITPIPAVGSFGSGPLNTGYLQVPLFYTYTSTPAVVFNTPVTVGICTQEPAGESSFDFDRLRLARNNDAGTGIEITPRVNAPFLDCADVPDYVQPVGLRGGGAGVVAAAARALATRAGRELASLLLPTEANAAMFARCCLGGSTTKLSPWAAVDTTATVSAVSPTTQSGTPGGTAEENPSVQLLNAEGQPMPGMEVLFAVTSGGGSLSDTRDTTNGDGVATAGTWTFGASPGTNTVTATVTPVGAGIGGSPVTFTATTSAAAPTSNILMLQNPAQEGTLTSISSTTPTSVVFTNNWTQTIKVWWLNYTGVRDDGFGGSSPYFSLAPGQSYTQSTFLTHPWLITDASDVGLGIYQPIAQQGIATFTGPWVSLYALNFHNIQPGTTGFPLRTQFCAATCVLGPVRLDVYETASVIATGYDGPVVLRIDTGPSGATLTGGLTYAVNGVADFADLRIDTPGTYTLRATAGQLETTTNPSFTVSLPIN